MASVVGDDACYTIGCIKEKVHVARQDAWSCTCKLMGVARYVCTWGLRRTPVALRVPQYSICPARCGFYQMDRAPPQQVGAMAYERSRVGLLEHEADVHTCKEGFPTPS
eukprot:284727-Chlamydomonas_euryale.AAC.1